MIEEEENKREKEFFITIIQKIKDYKIVRSCFRQFQRKKKKNERVEDDEGTVTGFFSREHRPEIEIKKKSKNSSFFSLSPSFITERTKEKKINFCQLTSKKKKTSGRGRKETLPSGRRKKKEE